MSTIGATQFKQECLAILDHLGPEGVVITKHGKPVARLVPIETESASLIGSLAAKIRIQTLNLSVLVVRRIAPKRQPYRWACDPVADHHRGVRMSQLISDGRWNDDLGEQLG